MKKIFVLILAVTFLVSCGGYKTSVTQKEYNGYLKFTGNTSGISVVLNDGQPFQLTRETELYELKPGKYNLKIYRGNNLIVDRIILVDKQITNEIEVP